MLLDGREITPEFLSGLILKKLRKDAEKRIEVLAKDDSGALGARPFAWEPERDQ